MSTPTTIRYTNYSWGTPDGLLVTGSAPLCDVTSHDKLPWNFVVTNSAGNVIHVDRKKATYNNVQLAVEKVAVMARFIIDENEKLGLNKLVKR